MIYKITKNYVNRTHALLKKLQSNSFAAGGLGRRQEIRSADIPHPCVDSSHTMASSIFMALQQVIQPVLGKHGTVHAIWHGKSFYS